MITRILPLQGIGEALAQCGLGSHEQDVLARLNEAVPPPEDIYVEEKTTPDAASTPSVQPGISSPMLIDGSFPEEVVWIRAYSP